MRASETRGPWLERLFALGCGLARSGLLLLAFGNSSFWWAGLLAPLPLVLLAAKASRPLRSGVWFGVGASVFWGISHRWAAAISELGFPGMVIHFAVLEWLLIALIVRLRKGMPRLPWCLVAPAGWTAGEVFRGEVLWSGYPWFLAGHPMIEWWPMAAPAAWLGVYSVSFLVVAISGSLMDAIEHRTRAAAAGGLAALAAWGLSWGLASPTGGGGSIRVGIVQTNLPQDNKSAWTMEDRLIDWQRFERLTLQAATERPEVIAWPETMFPGVFLDPVRRLDEEAQVEFVPANFFVGDLIALQERVGVPMLVGAIGTEGLRTRETIENGRVVERLEHDREFNSVFLLHEGAVRARYDKIHLTPFGEVMPLISRWAWLESKLLALGARGMSFGLSEGPRAPGATRPEVRPGVRVATPICFEVGDASLCRGLVFQGGERRAEVLMNLTNDGWFVGVDLMRRAAVRTSRWRCVELATPMARSANTGISCLIDARGRVLARGTPSGDARVDGTLVGDLPLGTGSTLYARIGDAFAWVVLAGVLFACALPRRVWRSPGRGNADNTANHAAASA